MRGIADLLVVVARAPRRASQPLVILTTTTPVQDLSGNASELSGAAWTTRRTAAADFLRRSAVTAPSGPVQVEDSTFAPRAPLQGKIAGELGKTLSKMSKSDEPRPAPVKAERNSTQSRLVRALREADAVLGMNGLPEAARAWLERSTRGGRSHA